MITQIPLLVGLKVLVQQILILENAITLIGSKSMFIQRRRKTYFIVNNGQKDIGFFCQDFDSTNMIVGGTVFIHPRSCKMSILKAIKAICIRACLIQDEFDACEVNTWAPLIVSTAQSVVPCLKESVITDKYRILYGETKDFPSRKDVIYKYNVTDIDADNCFVFDEVKRYGT